MTGQASEANPDYGVELAVVRTRWILCCIHLVLLEVTLPMAPVLLVVLQVVHDGLSVLRARVQLSHT